MDRSRQLGSVAILLERKLQLALLEDSCRVKKHYQDTKFLDKYLQL
jgi:hypothetical protein